MSEPITRLLEALSRRASAATGFSPDAMQPALRRFAASALAGGADPDELAARAVAGDAELVRALSEQVSIGETFFFRCPEQFAFLADTALPALEPLAGRPLRAWSAGCATGEEAWSIAACLRASLEEEAPVEVLGTDLVEKHLVTARAGRYRAWSVRRAGADRFRAYTRVGEGCEVLPELRSAVTFLRDNLLDPALPGEEGSFDVVFCRNVLVYFGPEAAQRALERLARALRPGGYLFCGAMDVAGLPPMLERVGGAELQAYRRPAAPKVAAPPPTRPGAPPPPRPRRITPISVTPVSTPVLTPRVQKPAPRDDAESCIVRHLEALLLLEQGEHARASQLLDEVLHAHPTYIPGLFERALLHQRVRSAREGVRLAAQTLELARRLEPDVLVPGPEPLPARFYVESASAFLLRHGGP